jgi:hypothetical protein
MRLEMGPGHARPVHHVHHLTNFSWGVVGAVLEFALTVTAVFNFCELL